MTLLRPTSLTPAPASPARPVGTAASARAAFFHGGAPAADAPAAAAPQRAAPSVDLLAAPSAATEPAQERYRRPGSLLDIRV